MLRACARRPLAAAAAALRDSSSSSNSQVVLRAAMSSSAAGKEPYSERQARTGRPVSPHVTIYKFPVGALTSIATRVTGGALTAGLAGISVLALGGADVPGLMSALGSSAVGPVAKVLFAFPLVFHYGSGLRHFVWDRNPDLLYNKGVAEASYVLVGATAAVSLAAGAITLEALPSGEEEKGKGKKK